MPTPEHHHARSFASLARALSDARTIYAVVALVAVLAVVSGCALDTESLDRKRSDLLRLCQGAITPQLKLACERAGVDTTPQPAVE